MSQIHQKLFSSSFLMGCSFQACEMCEGFYGPNFNQPVCCTCHYFLYPSDINSLEEATYEEKSDSDSGNEEPNEEADFYVKKDMKSINRLFVPSAPKVDRLGERIIALSNARDFTSDVYEGLVYSIPPEVLLHIFKYLDDISLWTLSNVCKRWKYLIDHAFSDLIWSNYINARWPLFKNEVYVSSWKETYTRLLNSAPCRLCLNDMMSHSPPPYEENSFRQRRLRQELKVLHTDPPEGINAIPLDHHCCHWQASITGPQGSPYQGGIFFLYIQIPNSYPMKPPVVRFITKIFHPNISVHGDIGLDSIQHNWSLALTISKVLISIQSLLTDPYCHVCMRPSVANLLQTNPSSFECIARLWTWQYAMQDFFQPCNLFNVIEA